MASDTRKITIEILDGSGETDKEGKKEQKKPKKTTKKIKEEIIKADAYKNAIKQVWNTTLNVANFSFNRYFTFSEDYISQNLYNNVLNSINKGKQLIGTAKTVAIMAATGNVVGAAVTAGVAVVNEGMQYYQRMSGYYQTLNATNYQTGFSATRAGLVNDSRGTEN